MNNRKFPHHTGGVVQVRHTERWGSVPEALLEDPALDLDSRAVAAWLAIKPQGWQISVEALRKRLGKITPNTESGRPQYRTLGKDRWQRIARELEGAGYLHRQQRNGHGGQWEWNIVFHPTPARALDTSAGFSGDGVTGSGSSTAGKPGNKEIPSEESTNSKTTTTTASKDEQRGEDSTFDAPASVVVGGSAEKHRDILITLLTQARLNSDAGQQIADELVGRLEAAARGTHSAVGSVRGWLNSVITQYKNGSFIPEFGRAITMRRQGPLQFSALSVTEPPKASRETVETNLGRLHETVAAIAAKGRGI
ncbi:hypothetical protein [Paraburkholderia kururiensis]|uniref:hypothetical protein n=1 Tax=Paraburkholderia kururiensis TaxID=984307 RepID=UPI001F456B6F|nr:hypothetical protein [Paraburkholderia kururiensis]